MLLVPVLVDSKIPTYLVNAPHAHKSDARRWLETVVIERQSLVTDVEVQEILHPCVAIDRRDAIRPAFRRRDLHRGWCGLLIGPAQSVRNKLSWVSVAVGARCGAFRPHGTPCN
jgi:hypothetical protein